MAGAPSVSRRGWTGAREIELAVAPDIIIELRRQGQEAGCSPARQLAVGEAARAPRAKDDAARVAGASPGSRPPARSGRRPAPPAASRAATARRPPAAANVPSSRRASVAPAWPRRSRRSGAPTGSCAPSSGRPGSSWRSPPPPRSQPSPWRLSWRLPVESYAMRSDVTRRSSRQHDESIQALTGRHEAAAEALKRRHQELTQSNIALRDELHQHAGALESARQALAEERAETWRLRNRLTQAQEHVSAAPAHRPRHRLRAVPPGRRPLGVPPARRAPRGRPVRRMARLACRGERRPVPPPTPVRLSPGDAAIRRRDASRRGSTPALLRRRCPDRTPGATLRGAAPTGLPARRPAEQRPAPRGPAGRGAPAARQPVAAPPHYWVGPVCWRYLPADRDRGGVDRAALDGAALIPRAQAASRPMRDRAACPRWLRPGPHRGRRARGRRSRDGLGQLLGAGAAGVGDQPVGGARGHPQAAFDLRRGLARARAPRRSHGRFARAESSSTGAPAPARPGLAAQVGPGGRLGVAGHQRVGERPRPALGRRRRKLLDLGGLDRAPPGSAAERKLLELAQQPLLAIADVARSAPGRRRASSSQAELRARAITHLGSSHGLTLSSALMSPPACLTAS